MIPKMKKITGFFKSNSQKMTTASFVDSVDQPVKEDFNFEEYMVEKYEALPILRRLKDFVIGGAEAIFSVHKLEFERELNLMNFHAMKNMEDEDSIKENVLIIKEILSIFIAAVKTFEFKITEKFQKNFGFELKNEDKRKTVEVNSGNLEDFQQKVTSFKIDYKELEIQIKNQLENEFSDSLKEEEEVKRLDKWEQHHEDSTLSIKELKCQ